MAFLGFFDEFAVVVELLIGQTNLLLEALLYSYEHSFAIGRLGLQLRDFAIEPFDLISCFFEFALQFPYLYLHLVAFLLVPTQFLDCAIALSELAFEDSTPVFCFLHLMGDGFDQDFLLFVKDAFHLFPVLCLQLQ
jgi:hypothetical protein